MKTLFTICGLVLAMSATQAADQKSFKPMTVKALAKAMTTAKMKKPSMVAHVKSKAVAVYDANNDDTREKFGIIPGATLLTSSKDYDTEKVLPAEKDTKLVFYCANKQCTASHAAAERATNAGYNDVNVLSDGIMGWKKAGQPVAKMN